MGLFDDVLAAQAPPRRGNLFADVLGKAARSISQVGLGAPAALHRGVLSETARLGRAAMQVPTAQAIAGPLRDIMARPAEALGIPTLLTAGFAPGTPLAPAAQALERRGQEIGVATIADLLSQEGLLTGIRAGIGGVRQAGSALRGSLVRRGLLAPEVLPAGSRPTVVRPAPFAEATVTREVPDRPLALPAPTVRPPSMRPQAVVAEPRPQYAPTFYSSAERAIEARMPSSAPVQQVRRILEVGVKQEELQWLDLDEFLKDKVKVSKQDVLDYVRANNVQVQEVVKSTTPGHDRVPARSLEEADTIVWQGREVEIDAVDSAQQPGYVSVAIEGRRYRFPEDRMFQVARRPSGINQETKFQAYQLPGGTNYRELLLTMPPKTLRTGKFDVDTMADIRAEQAGQQFRSPHFDEPNVLAHVRFNDRVDAQGKKVLFIEEIQSDWHQKGRKQGYNKPVSIVEERGGFLVGGEDWLPNRPAAEARAAELTRMGEGAVPDAPFKKTWHELALKRMIRWASEHGYDKLAWTTGEQQAARYDLSKQVDTVYYKRNANGTYELSVKTLHGQNVDIDERIVPERLSDHVGKEVAEKIVAGAGDDAGGGAKALRGLDLKVGGEGMKGFYDQILPSAANKLAKRFGGKVDTVRLDTGVPTEEGDNTEKVIVHSLDLPPTLKQAVLQQGQTLFEPKQSYGRPGQPAQPSGILPPAEKTPQERQREFDFQAQIKKEYAGPLSSQGGAVAGAAKLRLVALGIRRDLIQKGRVDFRGKSVPTPGDLARLAQVYRDPRFETFRIFYLQGNTIVAHEGFTSRMPGLARPFVDPARFAYETKDRMRRLKADGYYIMHNHTSGKPNPSPDDRHTTALIARLVPGFKAHVVIDDTTYAVMRAERDEVRKGYYITTRQYPLGTPPTQLLTPEVPHDLLHESVDDEVDVAEIGKLLEPSKQTVILIYRTRTMVRAIQEIPLHVFNETDQINQYILNRQREFGGHDVFAYFDGDPKLLPNAQAMLNNRVVEDVLFQERSLRSETPIEQLAEKSPQERQAGYYRVAEERPSYRPAAQLGSARTRAIALVQRELREQAQAMIRSSADLKRRVLAFGGIRPTLGGGLREELQAIRPYLRQGGQPIDSLATELGFEDGEALREALIAARQSRLPSPSQIRQQAETIVDSQRGTAILEALGQTGAITKASRRVVRDLTRQAQTELGLMSRQAKRLLESTQRQALTPTQVGRFARMQRLEPGATMAGPLGGLREASLTPEDVAQIAQRAGQIVPRPGQPTGTPPILPRGRSLIPADVPTPKRDLNTMQSTPFSGLDPSRAAELIDGAAHGATQQRVLTPLRTGELSFRQEQRQILQALNQVSQGLREGSPESRQVFEYLEGRRAIEQLSPRVRATAQWMAQQFDQLLERVNQARQSIGKPPILRRTGYVTHIKNPSLWEAMREAFGNVAPDASKTLETAFFERLGGRTPGFRFGLPRKGGPFEEDAIRAFRAYLPAALRVIHLSQPSRLATVYVNRSLAGTPNAHKYFSQLIRQVATGEAGPIARLTPETVLRASNWLRRRFGKGSVLGNLSSVLQQPFTLPATVSATGSDASTAAAGWLARGDGLSFALQWSPTLQARTLQVDVDLSTLASRWDRAMGAMFQAADRTMVAHAFLSGYLSGVKKGLAFEQAVAEGEKVALRTQSGFLEADLAPVFRDAITASALQFQTTINGVFNFMKFDIPRTKNPLWAAGAFVGTFAAMAAVYEFLGLPYPDRVTEFLPGWSTIRGGGPVGIRLLATLSALGDADPRKRAEAIRALRTTGFALAFGSGGNQIRKSFDGFQAVLAGGKRDKRGKLLFPVEGPAEISRAVAFGPYGTKAGRAYIRAGFKTPKPRFSLTTPATSTSPAPAASPVPRRGSLFADVLKK